MPKKKKTDLLKMLASHVDEESSLSWEGTLADYIEMVSKNPEIHMSSHTRVLRMIESKGVERDSDGNVTNYKFFENDLFEVGRLFFVFAFGRFTFLFIFLLCTALFNCNGDFFFLLVVTNIDQVSFFET